MREAIERASRSVKSYLETRLALISLELGNRLSAALAQSIAWLVLLFMIALAVFFLSFAFVFWYGKHAGPYYLGFIWVSLFYLVIGLLVFIFRKKWLESPLSDQLNRSLIDRKEFKGSFSGRQLNSAEDVEQEIAFLRKKAQSQEQDINRTFEASLEKLNPVQILQDYSNRMLTAANTSRIVYILLKWLTRRRR